MQLIFDDNYDFKGYGIHPSTCKVQIWEDAGKNVVLFTDLGIGTSVTNASEQLAEEIKPKLTRMTVGFFECYAHLEGIYDQIFYQIRDGKCASPDWKRMPAGEFEKLIE